MVWFRHHCIALLMDKARVIITVNKRLDTWYDPDSVETFKDSLIVLLLILKKVHPNVRINIFNDIPKLKELKPEKSSYNIVQWLLELQAKRFSMELKNTGCIS